MVPTNKKRLRDNDQDSDSDYENERSYNCNNWPRFLVMESSNDDLPLSKLSPFAIQKGFQAVAGTLKSIKRLRDGSFLVECGKRAQAQNLLRTNRFIDRPVRVTIHKTLNSSRLLSDVGTLLTWRRLRSRMNWKIRVWLGWTEWHKEGKVIPTNTLFLTFGSPELPKEITVGYLKVKVALFVPNPMRCFNCNKFGHTSQRCKVAAKCTGCGKDKHEGQCEGPKLCSNCNGPHASSAKDCPVWQKEKEIQRVRVAASTRGESRSVQCQTSLTWVCSDRPLRTTKWYVRSSGGPGSVSTGTFTNITSTSGKSRTVSADARVPCESGKYSSETDRGSANPPKTASRGSANPHKMAPKGSAAPSKSAHKGSAGPLKTVTSEDDSSSLRCSPSKVRADGVLVDVEGFSHPRRSTPSSRPQVPPKPVASDRLKKAEQNLVLSNHFSALSHLTIHLTWLKQWSTPLFNGTCEDSKPTSRSSLCFREGISPLCLDCRKHF